MQVSSVNFILLIQTPSFHLETDQKARGYDLQSEHLHRDHHRQLPLHQVHHDHHYKHKHHYLIPDLCRPYGRSVRQFKGPGEAAR